MPRFSSWSCLIALCVCACARTTPAPAAAPSGPTAPGQIQHVLLVTVDGLVPETYLNPDAHGLRVPNLRRIVAEGDHSDGALSTFPSVTYPAHTSLATGVRPARHGITSNRSFDALGENGEAWYWYTEELKARSIWQVAHDAGYKTALIGWPVTVGAQASWLVPEIWRARNAEDLKLIRALSTPGLLHDVERRFPGHGVRLAPPNTRDDAFVDVAVHVLQAGKPALMLLHIFNVDSAQHEHGLWSSQAIAAIENADQQLGRLIETLTQLGMLAHTALVVASDHGFVDITRQLNPAALLREAGLLEVDENGKVSAWRAASIANGGSAYIYVEGGRAELAEQVKLLFTQRAQQPGSGIARVLLPADIAAVGGDPRAALALDAEPGVAFGSSTHAFEIKPSGRATHGYDPERPQMRASLLVLRPGQKHGLVHGARLIDVAPTIARWLGLRLPDVEGQPLPL